MIRIKGKKDNPMGSEDKKFESYFHRAHYLVEELVSTYGKNLSLDENGEFNTFLKENHLSGKLVVKFIVNIMTAWPKRIKRKI